MKEVQAGYDTATICDRILTVRGLKVMLDSDLAALYGVEVRALNQQLKRNAARFPEDFTFVLTPEEWTHVRALRSQNVILKQGAHRKYPPRVLPEHGALMAANVLNSARAVEMSVFVVRAFVRMRSALSDTRELARKLATLERDVMARLDTHDAAIVDILRRFMEIIDPPALPDPPPKQIGFQVRERRAVYRKSSGAGTPRREEKE